MKYQQAMEWSYDQVARPDDRRSADDWLGF